eukprot:1158892-Pelagomonas_calceolata.AAC.24
MHPVCLRVMVEGWVGGHPGTPSMHLRLPHACHNVEGTYTSMHYTAKQVHTESLQTGNLASLQTVG